MIGLDFTTVASLTIVLSLVLSLILAIARVNSEGVHGAGYWSLSNVMVAIGLLIGLMELDTTVFGGTFKATLIAIGLALNILGIQSFNQQTRDLRIVSVVSVFAIVINLFLLISGFDPHFALILNTLLYATLDIVCAKMLLPMNYQKSEFFRWFNGSFFLAAGFFMLFKAIVMLVQELSGSHQEVSKAIWQMGNIGMLAICVKQLFTTFGFIMMMHQKRVSKLRELAMYDDLTRAYNRRGLMDAAEAMRANCERLDFHMSMIVLDMDRFKNVNDIFGHQAGDEVLRRFADCVRSEIRTGDLFGRYGGEEFCVLLHNTRELEAFHLAERIRESFATLELDLSGEKVRCTVSCGVSSSQHAGYDFRGLLAAGDSALYIAKNQGRNKTVAHSAVSTRLDHVSN